MARATPVLHRARNRRAGGLTLRDLKRLELATPRAAGEAAATAAALLYRWRLKPNTKRAI